MASPMAINASIITSKREMVRQSCDAAQAISRHLPPSVMPLIAICRRWAEDPTAANAAAALKAEEQLRLEANRLLSTEHWPIDAPRTWEAREAMWRHILERFDIVARVMAPDAYAAAHGAITTSTGAPAESRQ